MEDRVSAEELRQLMGEIRELRSALCEWTTHLRRIVEAVEARNAGDESDAWKRGGE